MHLEQFLARPAAAGTPAADADRCLRRLVRGPVAASAAAIAAAGPDPLLLPRRAADEAAARALLCGVLTALDAFDAAHDLAQELDSSLGSWWHAILHRREPDASNAGYWYRRVRAPAPVWAETARRARAALGKDPGPALAELAARLDRTGRWEPLAFVAACEVARLRAAAPEDVARLADVQVAEWRVLLEHCRDVAVGGG